ncbi:GtrA family protein [Bacillus sp. UNC41MFS5]|uniref:GtrA family protein n=1 Tax=Bacillus sp. UNC41MFS5 TaxID=1449046 RepID=UPI0009DFB837|nr:GtrA family protein [Bacillus sp. UNC41MFS5]
MNFIILTLDKYLKPTTSSLVRFLLVGIANTFIGLGCMFFLLNIMGLSYWTSTLTGNAIGASVSFLLNRTFTFKSNVSFHKGVPRFFVLILICYFLAYFCSKKLVELTSQYYLLSTSSEESASVLLGSTLYTIANYLGQKYIVFKNSSLRKLC